MNHTWEVACFNYNYSLFQSETIKKKYDNSPVVYTDMTVYFCINIILINQYIRQKCKQRKLK